MSPLSIRTKDIQHSERGPSQYEVGELHSDDAILWRGRKRKSREVLTHSEFKVTTANLAPVIIYE